MFRDATITTAGADLITQWFNGEKMTIERATAGQGTVDAEQLAAQTALSDEKAEVSIVNQVVSDEGLKLHLQFKPGEEAFVANQIGIWAKVGDEGASTLLALYQDETGIEIPAQADALDFNYAFYAIIAVDTDERIELTIDRSAYLTVESLNEVQETVQGLIDSATEAAGKSIADAKDELQKKLTEAEGKIDQMLGEADLNNYALKTDLDGKADAEHMHDAADITDGNDTWAAKSHGHEISEVTGLETRLTDMQGDIDSKAAPQTPISVAVTTDAWAEADGVFSHAFTATGVNPEANTAYVANLIQQGTEAIDAPARGAWGSLIRGAVTAENEITLWATDAPTTVINMSLVPIATKEPVTEILGILGGGGVAASGKDISKAVVTLDADSFVYNGSPQKPTVTKVMLGDVELRADYDYYVICDPQTEAGSYLLTVSGIMDYTGGVQKEWTITKAADVITLSAETATVKGVMGTVNETVTVSHKSTDVLTATVANGSDGGSVTASIGSGKVKLTSVKAGTCTVTVKSAGDNNYTGTSKTLTVTVQKADGKISVSPDTIEIMGEIGTTKTAALTISAGDAASAVTFTGGTDNVTCTYTSANKTITLKSVKETTAAVDVTVHLATSDSYSEATCVMHVSVKTYSATLESNTWAQIAAAAAEGKAESLWQLGDTKAVQIGSDTYHVQIIGFNHDDLASTDAKYSDAGYNAAHAKKAGITFQLVELLKTLYVINDTNTNAGGWKKSKMYTSTMGTIKATLPTDLQGVLRTVGKKTANNGSQNGSGAATLETANGELFLLSEVEVFNRTYYSIAGEGTGYAYWKAHNTDAERVKNQLGGSAHWWWLRSPNSNATNDFRGVSGDGSYSATGACAEGGVAFGFCV